jgi:hypothetical protein
MANEPNASPTGLFQRTVGSPLGQRETMSVSAVEPSCFGPRYCGQSAPIATVALLTQTAQVAAVIAKYRPVNRLRTIAKSFLPCGDSTNGGR